MNMSKLPRYKCHKEVWAIKIIEIVRHNQDESNSETDGSALLYSIEEEYEPIKVKANYMNKHKPEVGGYYVTYSDGYESYSPAKAFEDGYTLIT